MSDRQNSCCERFCSWLGSPSCLIYVTFSLSSWGDWMWIFSAGLYLVHFDNGELLLAAIFGFIGGCAVLLFGGILGNWVDKTHRLRVIRISLFAQNLFVALSAANVWVLLSISTTVLGNAVWYGCIAAVMVSGLLAQLASVCYKIAIEKDWVVVIAGNDKSQLSTMNSIIRSTDLTCKVLSPVVAGLVMTYGNLRISALMVMAWNIISVFLEYALLSRIYHKVPRLAVKLDVDTEKEQVACVEDVVASLPASSGEGDMKTLENDEDEKDVGELSVMTTDKAVEMEEKDESEEPESKSCLAVIFDPLIVLARGWRVYVKHRVFFAGLALALLYMTVLGFDSITTGYIYANGVSEAIVGLSMSLAGLTGLIGSVLFPPFRKRIGLERTGLFAFNLEVLFLVLCVWSVWLPGTVFDPFGHGYPRSNCTLVDNAATVAFSEITTVMYYQSSMLTAVPTELNYSGVSASEALPIQHYFDVTEFLNGTTIFVNHNATGSNSCNEDRGVNISIICFLIGIILSRIGLWMADLVVTQILQENVAEKERGIVNGVQNSLNMLFDLIKFVLVICVPHVYYFGYLIIVSFSFIVIASASFSYYSFTVRGHLLPHCCRSSRFASAAGSSDRKQRSADQPLETKEDNQSGNVYTDRTREAAVTV